MTTTPKPRIQCRYRDHNGEQFPMDALEGEEYCRIHPRGEWAGEPRSLKGPSKTPGLFHARKLRTRERTQDPEGAKSPPTTKPDPEKTPENSVGVPKSTLSISGGPRTKAFRPVGGHITWARRE